MLSTKIAPFTVFYENGEEFHRLKNEIFTQGSYYFETNTASPRIIDAGAHIGLATLYFKKLYPSAQITAIEPNPKTFPLLKQNIEYNFLDQVECVEAALAETVGHAHFFMDQTDEQWLSTASFTSGAWTGTQQSQAITVPTLPLTHFLHSPIDFLKMDIEGAEQAVLMACKEHIRQVHHMIVEFHPLPHQSLSTLKQFLEESGFRVQIWKDRNEVRLKQARGLVIVEAVLLR